MCLCYLFPLLSCVFAIVTGNHRQTASVLPSLDLGQNIPGALGLQLTLRCGSGKYMIISHLYFVAVCYGE